MYLIFQFDRLSFGSDSNSNRCYSNFRYNLGFDSLIDYFDLVVVASHFG